MMDKETLQKMLKLIDNEIEALTRAKRDLLRQLDTQPELPIFPQKVRRGDIRKFLHELLKDNYLDIVEVMAEVQRKGLNFSRGAVKLALERGTEKEEYSLKGEKWTLNQLL
jgi:hypothetical protein